MHNPDSEFLIYFQAVRNPDRCEVGAVSPAPGAVASTAAPGAPITAVLPVTPARLGWR